MELTVLGTAGTWPPAGGATCGFLVSHEGTNIWLDAGTGTFARLQEHIGIDDVAAIVVSHGHTDHFIDVIPRSMRATTDTWGRRGCRSIRRKGSSIP
jgi:ribonuclease BN (tRNA processing enzyme)